MSNEVVTQQSDAQSLAQPRPFDRMLQGSTGINAGAVAIESERAIAEARGQMQLAKMFPRSLAAARAALAEACKNPEFAAAAFYSVPNRGNGPSIRFAEEVARVYGNFQYGHRELSRSDGKSEIEVFAWDVENNNRSIRQITVMHVLDTKQGARPLKDQADIDNKIANVASKQMRGRILALVSKELVATGLAECKKTLAGKNDEPMSARVSRITATFAKLGVTAEALAKYIGHSLDDITIDEIADIQGAYNAIKEGAKVSDYFGAAEEQPETAGAAAAITQQAKAAAGKASISKKAEPEPQASQEGKPAESNSKPAKESRRDSGHKSDTAQPAREEPSQEHSQSGEAQPEQEGDVF